MPLCRVLLCAITAVAMSAPALAQRRPEPSDDPLSERDQQQQQQLQARSKEVPDKQGEVAKSAAGRAGERQTREQAAPNVHRIGRISSRIENRVQSRIRNRIDRNYDFKANAASPFKIAEEKARTTIGR